MDWIEPIFSILALGVLAFLVLLPRIISKGVEKGIEHVYDKKLEGLKGDIQASNAALKSSVDYLAASQVELRSKVLSSVESALFCRKSLASNQGLAGGILPQRRVALHSDLGGTG